MGRGAPPGDEGTNPGESEKGQGEWEIDGIEERRADGNFHVPDRLGHYGKDRPPEDGEADPDQEQVVEEEAALPGDEGIEAPVATEHGEAPGEDRHGEGDDASEEDRQDRPDSRDRKSTRLNSSHRTISYAVFCLKK